MSAEEPETEAGAANDETEVIGDTVAGDQSDAQPDHAWSDEDDDADHAEPERHSWSVVTGQAAVLISVGAAVAAITVMVGWLMLHNDRPASPPPAVERNTPSATAQPPSSPPVGATAATTAPSTPTAATGPTMGLPCSGSDYGKLAHDPTGQEIFCHSDPISYGKWEMTPSDVRGVHMLDTMCGPADSGLARSTDGYLIKCELASWAEGIPPISGDTLIWQRYRGMFDPGV